MEEKYFCYEISNFISDEELPKNICDAMDLFMSFIIKQYRFLTLDNLNGECVDKFLFVFLPKQINGFNYFLIDDVVCAINLLSDYLNKNYNIDIGKKYECDISEIKRLCDVKQEFDRFLNNPVLSYSPLVIDFQRYRNRALKTQIQSFFQNKDKGYFTVEDIFSETTVVVRKMYTGRFIKITLDREIVKRIKQKDILYMSVKQSPLFSWEIEQLFKYYPSVAINYLKSEVCR